MENHTIKKLRNAKEGDFVMIVREILRALYDREKGHFTAEEKSIILFLADWTIGQHAYARGATIQDFMNGTHIPERTVFAILKNLIEEGVLIKEKQKGIRSFFFALNVEFFGRVYPGPIENVYYLEKFENGAKVHTSAPSNCESMHTKHAAVSTFKTRKSAARANSASPNISTNISINISQRELLDFVTSRSVNSKKRWIKVINNIVDRNPEDQSCLWLAIEICQTTQKDFMGNPIRSSILSLFESSDWEVIRSLVLEKSKKEKERRENEKLIEETRKQLHEKHAEEISDPEAREQGLAQIKNLFPGRSFTKN